MANATVVSVVDGGNAVKTVPMESEGSYVTAADALTEGEAIVGTGDARGVQSAKIVLTIPATAATLTIAAGKTLTASASITLAGTDGKTLTVSNSLTLAGTDATVMTFPSTSATIARTDAGQTFTGAQSIAGVLTVASATATPANGSTAARLLFGTTAGFGIYYGSGAPTVAAAQGSLYLRSDGDGAANRAYINSDGATTWTAIATAG